MIVVGAVVHLLLPWPSFPQQFVIRVQPDRSPDEGRTLRAPNRGAEAAGQERARASVDVRRRIGLVCGGVARGAGRGPHHALGIVNELHVRGHVLTPGGDAVAGLLPLLGHPGVAPAQPPFDLARRQRDESVDRAGLQGLVGSGDPGSTSVPSGSSPV